MLKFQPVETVLGFSLALFRTHTQCVHVPRQTLDWRRGVLQLVEARWLLQSLAARGTTPSGRGSGEKGSRFLEHLTRFVLPGFVRCVCFPMGVEQHGARALAPLGQSTSAFPGAGDQRSAPSGALRSCLQVLALGGAYVPTCFACVLCTGSRCTGPFKK